MRNTKSQFYGLVVFLCALILVLSNGFAARIFAQDTDVDVYRQVRPMGEALHEILSNYVDEPEVDKVVEGALRGMMNSLDNHSSYISPAIYQDLREETEGEFEGIGVSIRQDENENIVVFEPIEGQPAFKEGLRAGDYIVKIDDVSTEGMAIDDVVSRIKGPRGTTVDLQLFRRYEDESGESELIDVTVKRERIPLDSIAEQRLFEGGIGYIRLRDFKSNSEDQVRDALEEMLDDGMRAFILDLRWNPGGLLTASKDVCDLFLPNRSLVTYTRGRVDADGNAEESRLWTQGRPILPGDIPMVLLTSGSTASSAEIVTGALQFHQRAVVVGEKTYGKGSVQTIIRLEYPEGAALRLTTALYYTPADVTINETGILPDVEVEMPLLEQQQLQRQMWNSYRDDYRLKNEQNHGLFAEPEAVEDAEADDDAEAVELVEDRVLGRAIEILNEDPVFDNLLEKYHRDVRETQVAKTDDEEEAADAPEATADARNAVEGAGGEATVAPSAE